MRAFMLKLLMFSLGIVFYAGTIHAQQISGKVYEADTRHAIEFAVISILSKPGSVRADSGGNFSIKAVVNDLLVISATDIAPIPY